MQIMHADGRFLHTLFIYSAPICQFMPCCGAVGTAESIEWFIEDQAFLQSNDSASSPPPALHPSPAINLSLFLSLPVCRRSVGEMWEGVGGRGAKYQHREIAWPSINHLILFDVWCIPRHFRMQIRESTYFARTGAHLSEHAAPYKAWRRLSEIMNAYAEPIFT